MSVDWDNMTIHFIHRGVSWQAESSAPYRCGAMGDAASSAAADVTCADCLDLMGMGERGVGAPTPPLHTPPHMNENDDGVFIFYGTHSDLGGEMEVVPMTTGNVEFTVGDTIFSLSHLDRADLIRALLHDFHYSPERGGPHDGTE